VDSTISGNTARGSGGGIYVKGPMALLGSTVTGNSAGEEGGGIFHERGSGRVSLDAGSSVTGNVPDNCVGTSAC
jgi:predicted outer membrane repeat protein